jgi:hypothetical protein
MHLRHLHRRVTPSSPGVLLVVTVGGWLVLRLTGSLTLLLGAVAVRLLKHGLTVFAAVSLRTWVFGIVKGAAQWVQIFGHSQSRPRIPGVDRLREPAIEHRLIEQKGRQTSMRQLLENDF